MTRHQRPRWALIACVLGWHMAAQADNHVFINGAPLLTVKARGVFEALEIGEETPSGQRRVRPQIQRQIKQLYTPGSAAAWPVQRFVLDPGMGCVAPDRVELSDGFSTDGVLSTKALPAPFQAQSQAAAPALRQQALSALATTLKAHQDVPARWYTRLQREATVDEIVLDRSGRPSLVLQTQHEQTGQRAVTVMMVLSPQASGGYRTTLAEVRAGGASDSDGYGGSWALQAHVDLDGDGEEELIVSESGYEWASTLVLRRRGQTWLQVVSAAGAGC
jgi:hypothetical protein